MRPVTTGVQKGLTDIIAAGFTYRRRDDYVIEVEDGKTIVATIYLRFAGGSNSPQAGWDFARMNGEQRRIPSIVKLIERLKNLTADEFEAAGVVTRTAALTKEITAIIENRVRAYDYDADVYGADDAAQGIVQMLKQKGLFQ